MRRDDLPFALGMDASAVVEPRDHDRDTVRSIPSPTAPLWTLPARLMGRIHAGAATAAETDPIAIGRLGRGRLGGALAVTAVIAALLPPLLHVLAPLSDQAPVDLLRIEAAVFTESLPFVIVAVVLGLVAPSLGVLITLAYAVADFGWDLFALVTFPTSGYPEMVPHPAAPLGFAGVVVGHVATYWLLWLVAVEVPLATRGLARSMSRRETTSAAALIAGSVAAAAMVFLWTLAAAVLVRAAFAGTLLRQPSVQAVSVLQNNGALVAIVAVVVASIGLFAWREVASGPSRPRGQLQAAGSGPVGHALVATAGGSIMMLIGLGGIIVTLTDLLIVLAATMLARPAALVIHRRVPALTRTLSRVPLMARLGIGFAAVYGIATAAANALYRTTGAAEFTPLVLTVGIGVVLLEVLLAPGAGPSPPLRRPRLPAVVGGAMLLMAIALAAPQVARADNCSGLQDCFPSTLVTAITAAAVTAIVVYRLLYLSGPPSDPPSAHDYPPMYPIYPTPATYPVPVTRRPWRSRPSDRRPGGVEGVPLQRGRPDAERKLHLRWERPSDAGDGSGRSLPGGIQATEGPRGEDTQTFISYGCGIRG